MPARGRTLGLVVALAAAAVARAQDGTRYWPLREINFPFSADKLQAEVKKPAKLRFYAARDRGKFELVTERPPTDLDEIDPKAGVKGFRYVSPADGAYEFALQFVYADGETIPKDAAALTPQYRVVFDTKPPYVQARAAGTTGLQWSAEDENLDPDKVVLEVRYPGQQVWSPVKVRTFGPRDAYTWGNNLKASDPIEARVRVYDKAGNDTPSRPVTLPASGAERAEPFPPRDAGGTTRGTGFGNPDDFPNRPGIEYVNTRTLTVESKLTRVTRSGVKEAHLWANDGKAGWKLEKKLPQQIAFGAGEPVVRLPYEAQHDGLYGFIVIPVSGADLKEDDPRPTDPAQILVEVDTEKPQVRIKGTRVTPGAAGPRVEIDWEAIDKNLLPDPIVLEYATEPTPREWQPVAVKVPNTGRYGWEVEDKTLWRVYLRIRATDKASNTGEHLYEKPVIVDLEKPQGRAEKVIGAGGPPAVGGGLPTPLPKPATDPGTPGIPNLGPKRN